MWLVIRPSGWPDSRHSLRPTWLSSTAWIACGNQVLAGPAPVAGRYKALADILADDQLYVNTASGTCNQYLAVEANAIGSLTRTVAGAPRWKIRSILPIRSWRLAPSPV